MATKYEWIAVYAFTLGVCDGCYEMLLPVITRDIVGVKNVGHAIGALYCLMAFPKTLGPPMVGWIFDASKNYNVSFYVTGGVALIAAIVMYTVNWVKFNDENEERIIRERLLPYNETSGSNQSIQYTWRFKAMGSVPTHVPSWDRARVYSLKGQNVLTSQFSDWIEQLERIVLIGSCVFLFLSYVAESKNSWAPGRSL